ncbi:hypothetical protein ACQVGZ_09035 [Enterococcus lactis]
MSFGLPIIAFDQSGSEDVLEKMENTECWFRVETLKNFLLG